ASLCRAEARWQRPANTPAELLNTVPFRHLRGPVRPRSASHRPPLQRQRVTAATGLNAGPGSYPADDVAAPAMSPSAGTERSGGGFFRTAASALSLALLNGVLNAGPTACPIAAAHASLDLR